MNVYTYSDNSAFIYFCYFLIPKSMAICCRSLHWSSLKLAVHRGCPSKTALWFGLTLSITDKSCLKNCAGETPAGGLLRFNVFKDSVN